MIAYFVAVFLLGVLFGGGWGFYNAERERERRERDAFKRMKEMRR